MFAGNFAPAGWATCAGQLMPISENETLFNLIGTTYGGDGQETFALPDLQGRIAFGDGGTMAFAQNGGTESVTLLVSELPIHTHLAQVSTNAATATTPANNVSATWGDGQYVTDAPNTLLDPGAIAPAGGSQPHENRPPYVAMTFIISLFGIFPSQT
jgi:microcystin-dependent protein